MPKPFMTPADNRHALQRRKLPRPSFHVMLYYALASGQEERVAAMTSAYARINGHEYDPSKIKYSQRDRRQIAEIKAVLETKINENPEN